MIIVIGEATVQTRCQTLCRSKLLTSGQSNLKNGRIAKAHRRFSGIRQVAPVWISPNACSLVPPESTTQTASRSVQPFLHCSPQSVFILYNGPPFPFRIAPSYGRI